MTGEMPLRLMAAMCAGVLLGTLHFGSLWMIVRKLPSSRHPMLLATACAAARWFITLGCCFLLLQVHWSFLATALVGFVLIRDWLIRRWTLSDGVAQS